MNFTNFSYLILSHLILKQLLIVITFNFLLSCVLFPQVFFSPRNVVSRIRQALDILHSEVCLHLLAQTYNLTDGLQVQSHNPIYILPTNFMFCVIQVPRAMVNLVELLNVVPLRDLHKDKSLGCPTWFVK